MSPARLIRPGHSRAVAWLFLHILVSPSSALSPAQSAFGRASGKAWWPQSVRRSTAMSSATATDAFDLLIPRPEWFAHQPFREEFIDKVRTRTRWNGTVPVTIHTSLPNTELIWFATLPIERMASCETAFVLNMAAGRVEFTIRGYGEFENSGFVRTDSNGTAVFKIGMPYCKEYGCARIVAGSQRLDLPYGSVEEAPHLHIHPVDEFGRNDMGAWLDWTRSSLQYRGLETILWSPLDIVPANATGIVYFGHEKFTRFLPWEEPMNETLTRVPQ